MIKNRWLFVLGRHPDLAIAELVSLFKTKQFQYRTERTGRHELIVIGELNAIAEPQGLLDRLGGTIKIVELTKALPFDEKKYHDSVEELLKPDDIYRQFAKGVAGRWTFGVSSYASHMGAKEKKNLTQYLHRHGLVIKKYFVSRKQSTRFVAPRGKHDDLSSVVVRKNRLVGDRGVELVLIATKSQIERGHTVAVQDFEKYSKRDYGRPERQAKLGSLPPKLAQIMLNLAQVPKAAFIHDPFVGIGTLMQEGLLMEYKITGSDNSEEQILRAKKNLQWFTENIFEASYTPPLVADAKKYKSAQLLDAMVTEGTLGPPRSLPYPPDKASAELAKLSDLWRDVLVNFSKQLKKDATVVAVWPIFATTNGSDMYIKLLDEIEKLGYRLDTFLPASLADKARFSPRETLVYMRPDQVVKREIIRLIRT